MLSTFIPCINRLSTLVIAIFAFDVANGDDFAALHTAAVNRQRNIIYNNDGAETAVLMTVPTAESFLALRTKPLVGTGVDTIIYCTRSSGFGLFTHGTKVGEVFATREGRYKNNQTADMLAAGIDPLEVIIDYAHQHGIELIWSMRMNDTHDAQRSEAADIIFRASRLKNEHPEYLLGTRGKKLKIGAWSGVNYARPEIRELAVQYFKEVCQQYDVDGVELDFFRHPVYFPSTTRGKPAISSELACLTDMVRQIREMTKREAQRRGRPIVVAVHCPDSVDYCRAMGIALDDWMEQGLFDLWIAGGTFQLNDWDYSVRVAREHGVKVYPSIDDARVRDDLAKRMRQTPLAYRARAANALASGSDGICMFNAFVVMDPQDSRQLLTDDIVSLESLASLDRDYFASPLGMVNSANKNYPLDSFQKAERLNGRSPKQIKPGSSVGVGLYVADDLAAVGVPSLRLRLRFKGSAKADMTHVKLNNQLLELVESEGEWLDFRVTLPILRRGANQIEVGVAKDSPGHMTLIDAVLTVEFK